MLFGGSPPFIRYYQDVVLNHTHAPHTAFHLKPKEGREIGDYPVKGKGCRGLFIGTVGAPMVL